MRGLSPVAASGGHSSSRCAGLSLSRPLLSRSTGSRRAGSVVVAHMPSCSAACGILPNQGSNPCPLNWQADSQPLCHQGSPKGTLLKDIINQTHLKFLFIYLFLNIYFLYSFKKFFIEIQLIYNVVLVSGIQQSVQLYIYIFFFF